MVYGALAVTATMALDKISENHPVLVSIKLQAAKQLSGLKKYHSFLPACANTVAIVTKCGKYVVENSYNIRVKNSIIIIDNLVLDSYYRGSTE